MAEIRYGQDFGMRCSGTNLMRSLMLANLEINMLPTHDTEPDELENLGWKHGGIGSKSYIYVDGELRSNSIQEGFTEESSAEALLSVAYRNPFTWLRSVKEQPHHVLKQYPGDGISFMDFLQAPWEAFASPPDESFKLSREEREHYAALNPPFEAYGSVLQKRAAKIDLFENLTRYQNASYVNLETLRTNPQSFIGGLATHYGLQTKEPFTPIGTYKGYTDRAYEEKIYPELTPEVLEYLLADENLDWAQEAKIGYRRAPDVRSRDLADPAILANPQTLLEQTPYHPRYYIGGQQV